MDDKFRKYLTDEEAVLLNKNILTKLPNRNSAQYYVTTEEWEIIDKKRKTPKPREFVEVQKKKDKKGQIVSSVEKFQSKPIDIPDNFEIIKISTSKTTGQQWIQYAAKKEDVQVEGFDLDAIISKHIKKVDVKQYPKAKEKDFDSLTYTDLHVGMDTDPDGNAMYPVKWDREEILKSAHNIVKVTIQEKQSPVLVVDELGDHLDGFNAQTTRGGHDLPQNMTNEEAFDTALEFKMIIADGLVSHYSKIIFNNICNDNHAGSFGYFVNQAFKQIIDIKYKNLDVEVTNHRQFINHYFIGNICFLITHGKDDKALKFGFKPALDPKGVEKIDQYCKQFGVYKKAELIIFKKGDSHQALFDMASSDDFYYFNYPALSPSSQWVQTNFKKGRRGFFNSSFRGLDIYLKPKYLK